MKYVVMMCYFILRITKLSKRLKKFNLIFTLFLYEGFNNSPQCSSQQKCTKHGREDNYYALDPLATRLQMK